jgi:transposase
MKKKLKIKRIQLKRKQEDSTINLTQEALARISITMLRIVNGINVNEIVNNWPLGERATFMMGWRLAQHMKASDFRILADMILEKAKLADPYSSSPTVEDD